MTHETPPKHDFAAILRDHNNAVARDPENGGLRLLRGKAHFIMGDRDSAMCDLEAAHYLGPTETRKKAAALIEKVCARSRGQKEAALELSAYSLRDTEELLSYLKRDTNLNRVKMDACLRHRKHLLRDRFENTPENIQGLLRVARLIREKAAMLHEKGNQLHRQMLDLWRGGGNEPFTDFNVELSLRVSFNGADSVLRLEDDNTGSDYVKMAEILDEFYGDGEFPGNLMVSNAWASSHAWHYDEEGHRFHFMDFEGREDDWGEACFFGKIPENEWRKIPVVYEFHTLLDDTHYAPQDIIRINDLWAEATVVWQHV
ncbi:MAG: hypothetical protein FWF96_00990 [Kiritimatiellaeota bacterium]|nr:hypothetical protein [Kiritimatiellota bacterium]